jgi:hypothetical protein
VMKNLIQLQLRETISMVIGIIELSPKVSNEN